MAKGEKMTIIIDEAGNVSVDIDGVVGKGCHAIQEAMSAALGKTTKVVTKKEFYQTVTKTVKVTR